MYVCMFVCDQKTRLFTVLPLENRHEMAFCRSVSQFIFLERCLKSRASLLSSAIPWVSNSCTADKNITVTGCVVPALLRLLEKCNHYNYQLLIEKICND